MKSGTFAQIAPTTLRRFVLIDAFKAGISKRFARVVPEALSEGLADFRFRSCRLLNSGGGLQSVLIKEKFS